LEDLGVDGRIIIKLTFTKWNREAWTRLLWLRIGQVSGACECIKPSESKKCGNSSLAENLLASQEGVWSMKLPPTPPLLLLLLLSWYTVMNLFSVYFSNPKIWIRLQSITKHQATIRHLIAVTSNFLLTLVI
jgi:hypothetical protein